MIALEEGASLARLTTLGTGGPARLGRPESVAEVLAVLEWAAERELPVEAIGLGSNLLVADEGVEGVIVRLGGELAGVRVDGDVLVAGGGATNAVCLHRARAAGLGGFEFASAIPGTAGAGVRMNAGAYGSDWASTMIDATVASAHGRRVVPAAELGLAYRHSGLLPGELVTEVRFQLAPSSVGAVKELTADLLARRKATQPTTKRTFGSVFKNPAEGPGAGSLIEATGLKGHRSGGAVISDRHANFIENAGEARTADALALMVEARRRVFEQFGVVLEHEVRLLGPIELPPL